MQDSEKIFSISICVCVLVAFTSLTTMCSVAEVQQTQRVRILKSAGDDAAATREADKVPGN